MNRNKKKMPNSKKKEPPKERTTKFLFNFLPWILALFLIIAAGAFLCFAIFPSGYFNVSATSIIWHDPLKIASNRNYGELYHTGEGENIFKLDIGAIAAEIMREHSEFKDCLIHRQFPNRLLIDIFARQPVVQVDFEKFYLVDKDAILLSDARDSALEGLVVVTGITWRPSGRIGEKYHSPRLYKVLELLDAIKKRDFLNTHSLSRIDVADHRNLVLFIDDNLQIKMGRDHFEERLNLLEETLSSSYIDKKDLEYIDLRFDDIIFGTR